MKMYLGTHVVNWLELTTTPLFVSNRQLYKRKTLPTALGEWALDSGGFSELNLYGKWTITYKEYAKLVQRYIDNIGNLNWAAPQDWMCEPFVINRTGLSVYIHQERTVQNYLDLVNHNPDLPIIPVIQGWKLDEYHRCIDMYADKGIYLEQFPVVGIGSVCRRQASTDIALTIKRVADRNIKLHGFGVKTQGLKRVSNLLTSADSLAWSYAARYNPPLPDCSHKNCANCIVYAEDWYYDITEQIKHYEQ